MWASRKPLTQPHGEAAFDGAPVTPVPDSGNVAQPSVRPRKSNVEPAPSVRTGPVAVSLEPPVLSVKAPEVPWTTQSASGPGVSTVPTVAAPVLARNFLSFV